VVPLAVVTPIVELTPVVEENIPEPLSPVKEIEEEELEDTKIADLSTDKKMI
jgi:hypothetical protein